METKETNMNDLLQLAKEKKLDIWTTLSILRKKRNEKTGIRDFLCNELYNFSSSDVVFFLPQLCNLALTVEDHSSILKLLINKCGSLLMALKMFCWIQGSIEDNIIPRQRTSQLYQECEMAAVNYKSKFTRIRKSSSTLSQEKHIINHHRRYRSQDGLENLLDKKETRNHSRIDPRLHSVSNAINSLNIQGDRCNSSKSEEDDISSSESEKSPETPKKKMERKGSHLNFSEVEDDALTKKSREEFFHSQLSFYRQLILISFHLRSYSKANQNKALSNILQKIQNQFISASTKDVTEHLLEMNLSMCSELSMKGIYLPISMGGEKDYYRVLRILPDDSYCLGSRERVPYMLLMETIPCDPEFEEVVEKRVEERAQSSEMEESIGRFVLMKRRITKEDVFETDSNGTEEKTELGTQWVLVNESDQKKSLLREAFPESWEEKSHRIRRTSPFGIHPRWTLQSIIVKSGDDLRQEQLAIQVIQTFKSVFEKAEIPLWLYSYSVMPISSNSGFIETIPNAISLDGLRKRIPNMKSLLDYFTSVYGDKTSMSFLRAQRNFVESLAAYSLLCYVLQVKDRHNGNILIDMEGHIIHIDYGYILTSSPGSINFETAPFKLTNEYTELMGGEQGDMFHYFKLLCVRGFLEIRKHYEKFETLIETLIPGSKMGCFSRKEAVIRELKDRFQLQLKEDECVTYVFNLIKDSVGNWRTNGYDSFQYYTNGIL